MLRLRDCNAVALTLLLLVRCGIATGGEISLRIDTSAGTLVVLDGESVVHTFADISIGRYGATASKQRGDNKTPLGRFRIGWIADKTRYHRFLGLNYPNLEIASTAFFKRLISKDEWLWIRRAEKRGEVPPQNTPLGGFIGIHGIGAGDPAMHQEFNWTNGCVALTNNEIDQLLEWVSVGTVVDIR
jgi:murein L,D-transpeptidase YafK